MWDRTITISSAGKTFSVTGWKVRDLDLKHCVQHSTIMMEWSWTLCLAARLVYRTWALDKAPADHHAEYSLHLSDTFTGKSAKCLQGKAKKNQIHCYIEACLILYRRLWHKVCLWTVSWWVSRSATSAHWLKNLKARGTAWLLSFWRPAWLLSFQREATSW